MTIENIEKTGQINFEKSSKLEIVCKYKLYCDSSNRWICHKNSKVKIKNNKH
jgi:hypothetical protein